MLEENGECPLCLQGWPPGELAHDLNQRLSAADDLERIQKDDPNHFRKLEDFPVQKKGHSLAVDEKRHRVYTPEEQEDGRPVSLS